MAIPKAQLHAFGHFVREERAILSGVYAALMVAPPRDLFERQLGATGNR